MSTWHQIHHKYIETVLGFYNNPAYTDIEMSEQWL